MSFVQWLTGRHDCDHCRGPVLAAGIHGWKLAEFA